MLFVKGFGATSAEGGAPVTPDTLFRMGSTTKMFTANARGEIEHLSTGLYAARKIK